MKRILTACLLGSLTCIAINGCSQTETATKETKIKTPGGETDVKTTTEVKKSGDHKE